MHRVEDTLMIAKTTPTFLLASGDALLLQEAEPALLACGARVTVVLSAEAALAAMSSSDHQPTLALIDVRLPGMPTDQLLAAVQSFPDQSRFPIVLLAESLDEQWLERLRQEVIDDVIPLDAGTSGWRLRIELLLRNFGKTRELRMLREAVAEQAQLDILTGAYNRSTILSLLFRETDRVQRMGTSLCCIFFDIDDFSHWNARLGSDACDELLIQMVGRIQRLLRSYDLFGRLGSDEFLAALPGCSPINAVLLAERIRESFAEPFHVSGTAIRLSACFAVASSRGRSPIVLLRELEGAMRVARELGPETIHSATDCPESQAAPVAFLSATSGEDLLAW